MTPEYIHAVHDTDGASLMDGFPGWVVITEAIGHDPNNRSGRDYSEWSRRGLGVVVRLNHAHDGEHGTIPLSEHYSDFAQRCANFVQASTGIAVVVIGNEPNLEGERPTVNGVRYEITAHDYARCYLLCRAAIKPGLPVLMAAVAPWNNQSGNWLQYLRDIAYLVKGQCDGFALHAYTHGADPSLVFSDHKQHGWYWHFRTYRDQLQVVSDVFGEAAAALFFGITETDQNDPWADADSGWVQNSYREISDWNHISRLLIRFVAQYRSNRDDKWSFADKEGVKRDFRRAVEQGHKVPAPASPAPNAKAQNFMPSISTGTTAPAPPASTPLTPRLLAWGAALKRAQPQPGQEYWELIAADGPLDRGGNVNIYVDVVDDAGTRLVNVPVEFYWNDGMVQRMTEAKPDESDQGTNMNMSAGNNAYGVRIADGKPSDELWGLGLVPFQTHKSYRVKFQRRRAPAQPHKQPPIVGIPDFTPPPPPVMRPPTEVPALAHPVQDPQYRKVTQVYGVNGDYYKRFKVDGVPLRGHNGIDFGTPQGTAICAVADGHVVEVAYDPTGYGLYIKIVHPWGESLYAHLSQQLCAVGDIALAGETIGLSGNTGNSSGPHLHFGLRVNPFNRKDGMGGYRDPAQYLINAGGPATPPTQPPPAPTSDLVGLIKAAAAEFGLDWRLVASQAWAESSWRANAVSADGARGLLQIMPATWAEWSAEVSAGNDPFDARQSARVGAAYLAHLLERTDGSEYDALIAYGWGIGNWLRDGAGGPPAPAQWVEYANKVLHGRDLLKAVGA